MTPRRHTRALLTLPLALLLVRAGAVAAPPDDAPPSDAGKLRDLKSPKGGWIMKLPERNSVEVVLPREEAVSAGTGARQQLVFEVRLTRKPRAPVRMIFHVQNRQGWYYQTARVRGIPSDRWWRIDTDFSAGSSEWEAVGHARPWDALSARGIVRAGIRLFSQVPYRGALLVREVRWAPGGDRADGGTAVVDLRAPPGPVRPAGLWELSFRLSRPVADPFGPESAGLVCEIVTPGGDTRRAAAFIYQDYERADADGRLVALGAPEWRVRFRPSEEGRFLYRLFTGGAPDRKAERRRAPQAEGWFVVEGDGTPQEVLTREAGEVPGFERFVLELGRAPAGSWRPELANEPAIYGGSCFRREAVPAPRRVWRPFIEWTARWGKWDGLGGYDMERAWEFDRAIAEAEAARVSLRCALLDDGPFLEHGVYRWPLNPLSRAEGGPLAGPGEFFTSDTARGYFLRRARYLIARYGHSPAVSGWCIASGLPASGVAEWHERVGAELVALASQACPAPGGAEEATGKPVMSLHPFAIAFSRQRKLGDFERGRPAGWKLDREESPGIGVDYANDEGSGGGDALAISLPATAELSTIARPMDDDLFDYDYLTFDVRMPEGSEGVGRAQVVVRDRDLLWFEVLAETPLRAGDWTRCVVDLTTAGSRLRAARSGPRSGPDDAARAGLRRAEGASAPQADPRSGPDAPPAEAPVARRLDAADHRRPWGGYTRSRVRQLAIRIFPNGATPAPVLLDHVKLFAGARRAPTPPEFVVHEAGPEEVGRFGKYEIVLDVTPEFSNPFDPDVVALDVTFTRRKDARKFRVPGFFYEPYERRLAKLKVGGREREVEELDVTGGPDWRIRFAPPETGEYTSVIRVKTKDGLAERPGPGFRCVESGRKGFIRVASDNRYFEHSTGEVFYPLGPVIRSPSDARDAGRDPAIRDKVLAAETRGTYQFDEYLEAMRRSGANWIRMWMCSWWCGLEWYRKWPGYGGTGWYNMQNAWRVDHVLDVAESSGVYVQLCLQNHGQASKQVDHEWAYNPYNRYEPEAFPDRDRKDRPQRPNPAAMRDPRFQRPAGWVENPHEFFRDARVRKARRKYLRYVVARWGYSTNVMAWVLSSEVEFTGEYVDVQYGRDDRDWKTGRWPKGPDRATHTLDWHRELAGYLREIDPSGHVVTSHFSHPIRGRAIWKLRDIGYVQSNAYSGFHWWFKEPKGRKGPNNCVPAPVAMKQYWSVFLGQYGKPVLVGEWGGHWMQNPIHFLDSELHTGTWASIMTPMAGATGYWWWLHVHYNDRYGVYTAVKRFLEGEDRRGLGLEPVDVRFENDSRRLDAAAISNRKQADVYVYQVQHALRLNSRPPLKGATMVLPRMKRGRYVVEIWDTVKGEPTARQFAYSVGDELKFELPEVHGDVALKVRPADDKRRR